jgi:hypothetical protein
MGMAAPATALWRQATGVVAAPYIIKIDVRRFVEMPQIIISTHVILPVPVVPVLVRLCQAISAAMACQAPQTPAGPSVEMAR